MPHVIKVFGPPGTGKTTKLLDKLEEEIAAGTDVRRIGYVTFSRSAFEEAKARAQRRLPGLTEDHFRYFRTIHGICYGEISMSHSNIMQKDDFLKFARSCPVQFSTNYSDDYDIDGNPIGWSNSPGNRIMNIRQVASARMLDPFDPRCVRENWPRDIRPNEVRHVLDLYARFKEQIAKFDFVDLLHMYSRTGAPLPIDVMIVDEAQDLSALQWALVHKMCANAARLYIAGDDDQAIYGFLGADPFGFLDHHFDQKIILQKTHRLRANVWHYARKIIERVGRREPKAVDVRGPGGEVNHWGYGADAVLERIGLDEVMVIGSTNYQLASLRAQLTEKGIPVSFKGKAVTQTSEATTFYWYHKARKGEDVPINGATSIARVLGLEAGRAWADDARIHPDRRIGPGELCDAGVKFIPTRACCDYLARGKYQAKLNDSLYSIASKFGLESTIQPPKVSLETYHGCKGREAKKVVLVTDCSPTAMEYADKFPDYERKLAYVGATRTREELNVCSWQSIHHMRAFR